ncbi:homeobox protein Cup9p [Monosporozyma unispora]
MNNNIQLPPIQNLLNSLNNNNTSTNIPIILPDPLNNNNNNNNNNSSNNNIQLRRTSNVYTHTPLNNNTTTNFYSSPILIENPNTKIQNDSNSQVGTILSKSSENIVTAKTISCKINYEKDGLKIIARKHCRYNLPKDCVTILNDWLMNHLHNPYPTAQEKRDLLIKTGLTKIQLSNWFINQRRRKIFSRYYTMAKSVEEEEKGKNKLPGDDQPKLLFTKRKKLIDRIDELKLLTGDGNEGSI